MYISSSKYTYVYVSNIEYAMLGFTVGGPKPEWHLYYVQLVISLDERLAHRTLLYWCWHECMQGNL